MCVSRTILVAAASCLATLGVLAQRVEAQSVGRGMTGNVGVGITGPIGIRTTTTPGTGVPNTIVPGQFPGVNPSLPSTTVGNGVNPFLNGLNPWTTAALGTNPYGAAYGASAGTSNPYGSYYETETGGFLRGTASIIDSQAKFMESTQKAYLSREQVRKELVANRQRTFDEELYERSNAPTWEEERQRTLKQELGRSLNNPPLAEIYSGAALNTILADLRRLGKDKGLQSAPLDLDDDVVRHINLVPAEARGNPGLLKEQGRLSWPRALRDSQYDNDREWLSTMTPEVVRQALDGRSNPVKLDQMSEARDRLQQKLSSQIKELSSSQYVEAKRFLAELEEAIKFLRFPNAGEFIAQSREVRGRSMGDFARSVLGKGMQIAPAMVGDEAAYVALHRALAVYDKDSPSLLTAKR